MKMMMVIMGEIKLSDDIVKVMIVINGDGDNESGSDGEHCKDQVYSLMPKD